MSVVVHPGGDLEISGILKQAEILNKKRRYIQEYREENAT